MKLPNREYAFIPPEKLIGYLLSETHLDGKSKAKFFQGLGFDEKNLELLAQALLSIARNNEVTEITTSIHGTKYVIEGLLFTKYGYSPEVRTVWIIDRGEEWPRFVTAYPAK